MPNQVIPAIIIEKESTASTGGKTDMYTFDSRVRYSETGEEGMPNPFNEDSMKSMVSENPIMRDALSYINAQFEM